MTYKVARRWKHGRNNAHIHILVARPTLYPIGSLLRADPFMQVGCRRIPDSPLRLPLPAESRHGRLMRQSCHRIGMAIFTALSPQVASARPLALLDGLAPFRCSSRERDMSMANITRRKKGFPAGEKEGGREGGSTSTLSPQQIRHRERKRGEGGKNASEWPPCAEVGRGSRHERAGRFDGWKEWHLPGRRGSLRRCQSGRREIAKFMKCC